METTKNKRNPNLGSPIWPNCLLLFAIICSFHLQAQTISRDVNPDITGTVCPNVKVKYKISNIGNYSSCTRKWTATGGTIQDQIPNKPTVEVKWDDTAGAKAKLSLSFTGCTYRDSKGNLLADYTITSEEVILSVKDQSWGSYTNSYNIDFCSKAPLRITMPVMNVQGSGQWYNNYGICFSLQEVNNA